jgi:hypothetical protein
MPQYRDVQADLERTLRRLAGAARLPERYKASRWWNRPDDLRALRPLINRWEGWLQIRSLADVVVVVEAIACTLAEAMGREAEAHMIVYKEAVPGVAAGFFWDVILVPDLAKLHAPRTLEWFTAHSRHNRRVVTVDVNCDQPVEAQRDANAVADWRP